MITSRALWPKLPKTVTALPPWAKALPPAQCAKRCATDPCPKKGVTVSQQEGRLVIALHIKVGYGLNIASITQSITHRVKDEVEHATGLKVARIDVFVDDIIDE